MNRAHPILDPGSPPMTRLRSPATAMAVALTLLTVACTDADRGADLAALAGTSWTLSALPGEAGPAEAAVGATDGAPAQAAAVTRRPVTLHFTPDRVHGNDGCNTYRGRYATEGEVFRLVGALAASKMTCPEPVMARSRAFTDALRRTRSARLDGGRLTLLDAEGRALATLVAQDRGLTGSAWQVTGYHDGGQAVVGVLDGTGLSLEFTVDGVLVGSAGCNAYRTTYEASPDGLALGPVAITKKMCGEPAGIMAQEAAFLAALAQATVVRRDGDRLELRGDGDRVLVVADRRIDGEDAGSGQTAPDR